MTINELHRRVKNQLERKRPFVLFSSFNDDSCSAHFQTDNNAYKVSDFSESGFVLAPFDLNSTTYLIPNSHSEVFHFTPDSFSNKPVTFDAISYDRDRHIQLIKQAIDNIKTTALRKVVLARNAVFSFDEIDIVAFFLTLLNTYPKAYIYCWYHPETGAWLGASPETLLTINNATVQTVALAGTQIYKDSLDVTWDNKNIEEQQFVTDYLHRVLSTQLSKIQISDPKTARAGHLIHLKSVLTGTLKHSKLALNDLIHSIHPTPAVCGSPKAMATAFIQNNEPLDRAFYSGFLGQINQKHHSDTPETDLVVNLRCMHINGTEVTLFAGGGITSKSVPEIEWEETESKIQTLKTIF